MASGKEASPAPKAVGSLQFATSHSYLQLATCYYILLPMDYYCIAVRTGSEEKFKSRCMEILNESQIDGEIILFKKKMRTKKGIDYEELFFPGYAFFMTECKDFSKFNLLSKADGFYHFLPNDAAPQALMGSDYDCIARLMTFGSTVDIVPVTFDENDRIVILEGPFVGFEGTVKAVNRRNHRVNIQLDFMNGMQVIGLTYSEVGKK